MHQSFIFIWHAQFIASWLEMSKASNIYLVCVIAKKKKNLYPYLHIYSCSIRIKISIQSFFGSWRIKVGEGFKFLSLSWSAAKLPCQRSTAKTHRSTATLSASESVDRHSVTGRLLVPRTLSLFARAGSVDRWTDTGRPPMLWDFQSGGSGYNGRPLGLRRSIVSGRPMDIYLKPD